MTVIGLVEPDSIWLGQGQRPEPQTGITVVDDDVNVQVIDTLVQAVTVSWILFSIQYLIRIGVSWCEQ